MVINYFYAQKEKDFYPSLVIYAYLPLIKSERKVARLLTDTQVIIRSPYCDTTLIVPSSIVQIVITQFVDPLK